MKKIILIGASGYVGSAIMKEALNRGMQVTAIVRHPEKITIKDANLTVKKGDVTDIDKIARLSKGADVIVSAYNPGWNNPDIYEETLSVYPKILEAVKKSGVPRFLMVGGGRNFVCRTGTPFDRFRDDSRNYFTGSEVIGRVLFKYFIERKRGRLGVFFSGCKFISGKTDRKI